MCHLAWEGRREHAGLAASEEVGSIEPMRYTGPGRLDIPSQFLSPAPSTN